MCKHLLWSLHPCSHLLWAGRLLVYPGVSLTKFPCLSPPPLRGILEFFKEVNGFGIWVTGLQLRSQHPESCEPDLPSVLQHRLLLCQRFIRAGSAHWPLLDPAGNYTLLESWSRPSKPTEMSRKPKLPISFHFARRITALPWLWLLQSECWEGMIKSYQKVTAN